MRIILKPMKKQVFDLFISILSKMVDFVLKILSKLTKISPYMTKLLSFCPILLATRSKCISEDSSNEMKKVSLKKFDNYSYDKFS